MTEEQAIQAVVDTIGNHSDMIGGIFLGMFITFGAMMIISFFGGLLDLGFLWLRKKIKGKKEKEQG